MAHYYKPVRQSLKTKKWEKFRDKMMRKSDYLCQESLRYGLSVPAEMIHHIFPVSEYPELEFVEWNCLALTNRKHNTFHDRVNDKVVGQGIYWQKRERRNFKNFMDTPPLFEIFLSVLGTGEGNFFQVGGAQRKRG